MTTCSAGGGGDESAFAELSLLGTQLSWFASVSSAVGLLSPAVALCKDTQTTG